MYIDSHCHLNYPDFQNDFDDMLTRAKESNVDYLLSICTKLPEFASIHKLAQDHDHIFCTVGVHPHEAEKEHNLEAETIIDYTKNDNVVGIGETGLDYYYENSPKQDQKRCFKEHIYASQETQLPIIVHTRDADDDTISLLEEGYKQKAFPGLIHCFSTTEKLAFAALDLGFYISISGIITFKKAQTIRDIVKKIPLDRLLIETDSPYLAPVPNRGKRNEPSFVKYVADEIAQLKNLSSREIGEITSQNFFDLFTKINRNQK